ncbi:MAG: hypothetical protein MJE77_04470 [Proteobacteria bacterium]|nr:hypothetical protein [Pseudomonadota bacterium]
MPDGRTGWLISGDGSPLGRDVNSVADLDGKSPVLVVSKSGELLQLNGGDADVLLRTEAAGMSAQQRLQAIEDLARSHARRRATTAVVDPAVTPIAQSPSAERSALAGDVGLSQVLTGTPGNDTLIGTEEDDTLEGLAGNDTLLGAAGADLLDGGDGVDLASYAGGTGGVSVSLAAGTGTGNHAEGDTLVSIENVRGSDFDDTITGDAGRNTLFGAGANDSLSGGGGRDVLDGGDGADVLDGGDDADTASYASAPAGVVVDLVSGGSAGEAAGDTYLSIEIVRGSNFDDSLTGDAARNTLLGAVGDDSLHGGGDRDVLDGGDGADLLDGGDGVDTASYGSSPTAVVADLVNGGSGGHALGDSYVSIEIVRGTNLDDTLRGDGNNNQLLGGGGVDTLAGRGGDDVLVGGAGGDALDGGDGFDFVVYSNSSASLTVDLAASSISGGEADGDSLVGIENVRGTDFDDSFTGDSNHNMFIGASGNDSMICGDGDDSMLGGAGADVLDGGNGIDAISYNGSPSGVTVDLAAETVSGGHADGDTISSIEQVTGSDFDDVLIGNSVDNILNGGPAGNDILDGADGNDTASFSQSTQDWTIDLVTGMAVAANGETDTMISIEHAIGAQGNDTIIGTDSNNTLSGREGNDFIDGAGGTDELNYTGRQEDFTIDLASGTASAPAIGEADTLVSMEDAVGGDGDDTFIGTAGQNVFYGGPGADAMDGGDGEDWSSYQLAEIGVTADLVNGGSSGEAAGDTFTSIENLRGSDLADILRGDAGSNTFFSALGDDVCEGRQGDDFLLGGGGADVLDGGDGVDYAIYSNSPTGIVVDLSSSGPGIGGDAEGDTFIGIENVRGSEFADACIGNGSANIFISAAGDDTLNGGGGNDVFLGGPGDDTFIFLPAPGRDRIAGFAAGPGSEDVLDVRGLGYRNLAQILADSEQSGPHTFIRPDAANSIMLIDVDLGDLHDDDFVFLPALTSR